MDKFNYRNFVFFFIMLGVTHSQILFAWDAPSLLAKYEEKRFTIFNSRVSSLQKGVIYTADRIEDIAFSPDGQFLASSHSDSRVTHNRDRGYNGGINIWDAHTLEYYGALAGHTFNVSGVSFSPNGGKLVSVSEDHTIRIWSLKNKKQILKIEDVPRFYHDVVVLPSGDSFITAGSSKIGNSIIIDTLRNIIMKSSYILQRRDLNTGNILNIYVGHADSATSIALSPDGKTFATSSLDGSVRIWDIKTGDPTKIVFEHEDGNGLIYGLSYSKDGKKLAYGMKGKLYFTDLNNIETAAIFESPSVGVEFILNDAYIIAYSSARFVIWDMTNRKPILDLSRKDLGGMVGGHAVSPDGKILALGFNDDKDKKQRLLLINIGL